MRPTILIFAAIVICSCAVGAGHVATPPSSGISRTAEPDWTVLRRGSDGRAASGDVTAGRRAPFVEVATGDDGYRRLWDEHINDSTPPPVDFSRSLVVFLILPPQPTGGYSIDPVSYEVDGSTLRIEANLRRPGKGSIVTQAFTAPYAVFAIPHRGIEQVDWINEGRLLARRKIVAP